MEGKTQYVTTGQVCCFKNIYPGGNIIFRGGNIIYPGGNIIHPGGISIQWGISSFIGNFLHSVSISVDKWVPRQIIDLRGLWFRTGHYWSTEINMAKMKWVTQIWLQTCLFCSMTWAPPTSTWPGYLWSNQRMPTKRRKKMVVRKRRRTRTKKSFPPPPQHPRYAPLPRPYGKIRQYESAPQTWF